MYKSDVVQVDSCPNSVEVVWQEAKKLSTAEKAELVNRLLRKDAGLVVVTKHTHLVDYIIAQMTLLSSEGLAHVLKAIASRIACDGHNSRH
jgi:hypothetical protein